MGLRQIGFLVFAGFYAYRAMSGGVLGALFRRLPEDPVTMVTAVTTYLECLFFESDAYT